MSEVVGKTQLTSKLCWNVSKNQDVLYNYISFLICQGLRFSSVSQLPEPASLSGSSLSLSKAPRLPPDLSTDHSMKAFRQMKLSNTLLGPGPSSLTSKLGDSYRQFSSNFASTTSASKSRWNKTGLQTLTINLDVSGSPM